MAAMPGFETLRGALGMRDAIDLLEKASSRAAAGGTFISPKFNTDFDVGSMRMLDDRTRHQDQFQTLRTIRQAALPIKCAE